MLSKFVITDAGLAHASIATPTGPFVEVVGFKIGSGYGYTPLPGDTGLTGTLLYESGVSDYAIIDAHTMNIICKLPADAGPFDFGEIAIYLADGTMFAKAVYDTPQAKFTSLGTNVLSTYTFNCLLRLQQSVAVFNVASTLPEHPSLTFSPTLAPQGTSMTLAVQGASSFITAAVSMTTLYNDGTMDGPTVIGSIDLDGNLTYIAPADWTGERVSAVVTVMIDDMIFKTFTYVSGDPIPVPVIPESTPTGSILWFPGTTPPDGFMEAAGTEVSRIVYPELFSIIGTTYGAGDGSTTFNLPDLRGEFVRGWDNGRGIDSGRTLGSWQADEFKSHTHSGNAIGSYGTGPIEDAQGNPNWSLDTIGSTGGTETRPRNIALMPIIKVTGTQTPIFTFGPRIAPTGTTITLSIINALTYLGDSVTGTISYSNGTVVGPTAYGAIDPDGNLTYSEVTNWPVDATSATLTVRINGVVFRTFVFASNASSTPELYTSSGSWTSPITGFIYVTGIGSGGTGGAGGTTWLTGEDSSGGGGGGGAGQYKSRIPVWVTLGQVLPVTIVAGGETSLGDLVNFAQGVDGQSANYYAGGAGGGVGGAGGFSRYDSSGSKGLDGTFGTNTLGGVGGIGGAVGSPGNGFGAGLGGATGFIGFHGHPGGGGGGGAGGWIPPTGYTVPSATGCIYIEYTVSGWLTYGNDVNGITSTVYTPPPSGGGGPGGGGGGGGGSVSVTSYLHPSLTLAGGIEVGAEITLLGEDLNSMKKGPVISNRVSTQNLLTLVSASGIRLTCSDNTPLTLEDGSAINSTEALGVRLPVLDASGFRWEEIVQVLDAGRGEVATIYVDDQCYAAGDEPDRYIFTHNVIAIKD